MTLPAPLVRPRPYALLPERRVYKRFPKGSGKGGEFAPGGGGDGGVDVEADKGGASAGANASADGGTAGDKSAGDIYAGLGLTGDLDRSPDSKWSEDQDRITAQTLAAAFDEYPILRDGPNPVTQVIRLTELQAGDSDATDAYNPQIAHSVLSSVGEFTTMATTYLPGSGHQAFIINDAYPSNYPVTKDSLPPGTELSDIIIAKPTWTSIAGPTWHEVGHMLANQQPDTIRQNPAAFLTEHGITFGEVQGVSHYAASDPNEAIGELSGVWHMDADALGPKLKPKVTAMLDDLEHGTYGGAHLHPAAASKLVDPAVSAAAKRNREAGDWITEPAGDDLGRAAPEQPRSSLPPRWQPPFQPLRDRKYKRYPKGTGKGGEFAPGGGGGGGGGDGAGPSQPDTVTEPHKVNAAEFHAAFAKVPPENAPFLTHYSLAEQTKMDTYLSHDGLVGGAIKTTDDGHKEAVSLFRLPGAPKGSGMEMLDTLKDNGATRLDAIGDGLRNLYTREGFAQTKTIKWDDKYAPDGWDYDKNGRPNIYVMDLPNTSVDIPEGLTFADVPEL